MKIAILTTDNREHCRRYDLTQPQFGTAPEALLQGFARLPETEVHVVSCTQRPMASPVKIGPSIFFHSLHVPKMGWMRTGYQGCIRAARNKLREIRPDIVHGQGTERDCALSAVFSGFPNIVTIHGNMKAIAEVYHARIGSFYWLAARLETLTLKRTAGVFCNSTYTEELVGRRATQTWRVPNALREIVFSQVSASLRGTPPVLLNIGVVEPRKRQREILGLAGRLWRRGLRFELRFAGATGSGTEYGRAFLGELAEAEKAGYARHLGTLTAEQLIAAIDAASALVHAPTEESFGLVVAEALARNLKLFASATGGVVDIATGVEGTELFPASDWMAMEKGIANWLESGSPRPSSAAAVMRERYHPLVVAGRHLEIYRKIVC